MTSMTPLAAIENRINCCPHFLYHLPLMDDKTTLLEKKTGIIDFLKKHNHSFTDFKSLKDIYNT